MRKTSLLGFLQLGQTCLELDKFHTSPHLESSFFNHYEHQLSLVININISM